MAPPGGERFLVVRWHEHVVTVSPSEQGTLRTLGVGTQEDGTLDSQNLSPLSCSLA